MGKLISVLVLTYNQFHYLKRLLDTIINQTYPEIEIVVCDDGSVDFDAEAIERYILENKRKNIINYKILHSENNQGTVKNINNGIRSSSGQYIKIIAGDDLYPSERVFENQIALFDNENYMLVTGKVCDCLDDETRIKTKSVELGNDLQELVFSLPKEKRLKFCLKHRILPYVTQAFCFKRDFFEKYGLFDERFLLMEDSEMADRIINTDLPIGILPELVVLHRIDTGVSSNRIVINPKSIKYYEDTKNWFNILFTRESNLLWKLIYHNHYMMACFRIEMIHADSRLNRFFCLIKYLPSLIYYAVRNTSIIGVRIKGLIESMKSMKT